MLWLIWPSFVHTWARNFDSFQVNDEILTGMVAHICHGNWTIILQKNYCSGLQNLFLALCFILWTLSEEKRAPSEIIIPCPQACHFSCSGYKNPTLSLILQGKGLVSADLGRMRVWNKEVCKLWFLWNKFPHEPHSICSGKTVRATEG